MSTPGIEEPIIQQPLFQGLKASQLEDILAQAQKYAKPRKSFFFHQGDPAIWLYMLIQGRVRLLQLNAEGQRVLMRVLTVGEIFGGLAIFGETSYPVSAEAVEDSQALGWDGDTMVALMERYPRLAINALGLLANRLKDLQDRYQEIATERVERRLARALLRLSRQTGQKVQEGVLIDFPLSREDLAEMIGTTLYTVSRLLSRWEKRGFINTSRQHILICLPHCLVAIAEDVPPSHFSNP